MGHGHHHSYLGKNLYWALSLNLVLTLVEWGAGWWSGSNALMADALHNFGDAGALLIAALAHKIGRLPASASMTYGYKRAETLGALLNSTLLLIVGLFLLVTATTSIFEPQEVKGRIVMGVAAFALLVDLLTACLTYHGAKDNLNMRAVFLHNLTDAISSVVVLISGLTILLLGWNWVDIVATYVISVYVIYHALLIVKSCLLILMQSAPAHIEIGDIQKQVQGIKFVENIHHIHIWQLDDHRTFFEAHVVIAKSNVHLVEKVKKEIRQLLAERFRVHHCTLEIEIELQCQD